MKAKFSINRLRRGQTLVIALIILFVLLIIGFVFLGILNRNIFQSNTAQQRTLAADLADAGIRYAQEQLLNNPKGADWRPAETLPLLIEDGSNPPNLYSYPTTPPPNSKPLYAVDPDEYWIRPASLQLSAATPTSSGFYLVGTTQYDEGGPDGLGPFSRIQFKNGRALIRVRYAPSDIDINAGSGDAQAYYGPLRQPGLAHNYLIIESVGRPGLLNPSDPTSVPTLTNVPESSPYVNANNAVMFQQFPSQLALQGAVQVWSEVDNQFVQSRKLMAFASIGIIDHALYVTNKENLGTQIELGIPTLPVAGVSGAPQPPLVLGQPTPVNGSNLPGGGSVYVNGNVTFYGNIIANLNEALGDGILVAGTITMGQDLVTGNYPTITLRSYKGSALDTTNVVGNIASGGIAGSSGDPNFNTYNGEYRDSINATDTQLHPRSVTVKAPPAVDHVDIDTNNNRYLTLTRDSGPAGSAGYAGLYGHGQGVYVGNTQDLQIQNDANGHITAGAVDAFMQDILNPSNGLPGSFWHGQYYVPPGAYLQLEPDGFEIFLDQGTFKDSNGNDSGLSELRYRIGGSMSNPYIVDTLTPGVDINAAFSSITFTKGQPFNGVLYFEGNVRVRGPIPTFCPLTVVSMGNIYIEGSITKGVLDTTKSMQGTITSMPTTGIALLARDYVLVNPTQFFGPGPNPVQTKADTQSPIGFNPVWLPAAPNNEIDLLGEFLLDPNHSQSGQPNNNNPSFWAWYSAEYATGTAGNTPELTRFLISQSMDNGPASLAYVSLDVDPGGVASWNYLFPQPANSATAYGPIYELGSESYQVFSKFETNDFPFLTPSNVSSLTPPNYAPNTNSSAAAYGGQPELSTPLVLHSPPITPNGQGNDALIGGFAVTPHDVRIEATIYAQEGSFFVIPGQWFNPNPNDTRANYAAGGSELERLEDMGNGPYVPFYQEPLDIKITIDGAISENLPPPLSQQIQADEKWSWIPSLHGSSGEQIPTVHNDAVDGFDVYNASTPASYVPNLFITYDPNLGTGRSNGYTPSANNLPLRKNPQDPTGLSMLPPLPCLPVSPTLFYFGEVNP